MLKFAFQTYARSFAKPLVTAHGNWSVREGILIAVTNENGILRLGEIAPLPWFGSETFEEAIEWCRSLGSEFDENLIIPNHLPCCRFAFESARLLQNWGLGGGSPESKSIAALLPAGSQAIEDWKALYATGSRTFKWKIGVANIESELQIFQQLCDVLPEDTKIRLDANAGLSLSQAQQWLDLCDLNPNIEYLEQPLGIQDFDSMLQLSQDYKTPIALDESIATYSQLEDCYNKGWRGIFVVKPAISGAPSQLKEFCKTRDLDLVFSSVFETPIGRDSGLKLAQELGTHRALGYGTDRFFDPNLGDAIGISEKEHGNFLVQFWRAIVENRPVFFGNPDWGKLECDRFAELIETYDDSLIAPYDLNPIKSTTRICIPTGGTSGQLKFAVHTWETLSASVQGMQQHFKLDQIHSFCTLPLHHVSGFMQYFRSHLTQGQFIVWDWKELEKGNFPSVAIEDFFISLVPTQLQRLIHQPKLQQFKTILLGGAPAWESLLSIAREKQLPIALTYGMTEMASQISTLLPKEFLSGNSSAGKPLPHIKILPSQNPIQIQSKSQMLTDYPPNLQTGPFLTDDRGYLDDHGDLHILGRTSDKIITGGENIYPSEVEALIRATGLVEDVCVLGVPDETWGQIVLAVYVNKTPKPPELGVGGGSPVVSKANWQGSPAQYPKQWIELSRLPRTAQGKLDRTQLLKRIQTLDPNLSNQNIKM